MDMGVKTSLFSLMRLFKDISVKTTPSLLTFLKIET
jgi:hypothetical protein